MCLSTIYRGNSPDESNKLLEYVTEIVTENGELTCTDITGQSVTLKGSIERIDLIKNIILLQEA